MSENALERLAGLVERIIHPPAGDGSWVSGRLGVGKVFLYACSTGRRAAVCSAAANVTNK